VAQPLMAPLPVQFCVVGACKTGRGHKSKLVMAGEASINTSLRRPLCTRIYTALRGLTSGTQVLTHAELTIATMSGHAGVLGVHDVGVCNRKQLGKHVECSRHTFRTFSQVESRTRCGHACLIAQPTLRCNCGKRRCMHSWGLFRSRS
jgi:hypothetical protein